LSNSNFKARACPASRQPSPATPTGRLHSAGRRDDLRGVKTCVHSRTARPTIMARSYMYM
jgi:hypothetical protein